MPTPAESLETAAAGLLPAPPHDLAEVLAGLPAAWTFVLAGAFVVGLVLLLFGGRLARKGVMLGGLVVGGLGAVAAATQLGGPVGDDGTGGVPNTWLLGFGIGGALAGVLLAWLLFRFWMALSAALVLAAVVPLTAMIWEGNAPPISAVDGTRDAARAALGVSADAADATNAKTDTPGPPGSRLDDDLVGPPARPAASVPAAPPGNPTATASAGPSARPDEAEPSAAKTDWRAGLQAVYDRQAEEVRTWWIEMPVAQKRVLQLGAGIGACVGLVLGLAAPLVAAGIQSAVLGGVLTFAAGRGLLLAFVPGAAGVVPGRWRGVLLSVGLITVLGLLVQWALRHRRSDDVRHA